jgi:Kef-type K+ transport system membrane component KefB
MSLYHWFVLTHHQAFLVGLICPHDGGFAIKLTEKIEDLVSVIFLPLYFALSGLSTNLGLLNDGITWAYVIGVIAVAFSGKIVGGTLAARANKLVWRESFTIGVLMSCKGLVELIVLVSVVSYEPRRLRNVWPTNLNRTLACKPRSSRQGLSLFLS